MNSNEFQYNDNPMDTHTRNLENVHDGESFSQPSPHQLITVNDTNADLSATSNDLANKLHASPEDAAGSLADHTPPEDIPQGAKRNRLTRKQRDALLDRIVRDYSDGLPPTAIMLRHGLSRIQVKEFLAELFLAGAITQKARQFEVIEATGMVKKTLALKEHWEWLKLEQAHDGRSYTLSEYTVG